MGRGREDTFLKKIFEQIEAHGMILPGEKVIAGVSGGADSVCLLAVLMEYRKKVPFSIAVVHVEHGLRGEESMRDARFVEKLCRDWDLPFYLERVDIKKAAAKKGMTVEEAGRSLRYGLFEKIRAAISADKIAVAHNQNDQAETVLMNLSRGSGLRGLGGMRPVRGRILRPLLCVSREEIEEWLHGRNQSFCTDSTNFETDYTRNRIRLEILPQLEQGVNRAAVRHMADCALRVQRAERYLQKAAQELYDTCVERTGRELTLSLPEFLAAEEILQEYVLRQVIGTALSERGLRDYTSDHIEDLRRLAGMPCGKQMMFPGGLRAFRRREGIVFLQGQPCGQAAENADSGDTIFLEKDGIYELNGQKFRVKYRERPENMHVFPEKKYTKWLSYDTINNDVCLRTRRKGDYLMVNREGGKKKLKDYLIERKIPREERSNLPLVAQGSHILWVVGERISEKAKISGETKQILMIQKMEEGT